MSTRSRPVRYGVEAALQPSAAQFDLVSDCLARQLLFFVNVASRARVDDRFRVGRAQRDLLLSIVQMRLCTGLRGKSSSRVPTTRSQTPCRRGSSTASKPTPSSWKSFISSSPISPSRGSRRNSECLQQSSGKNGSHGNLSLPHKSAVIHRL